MHIINAENAHIYQEHIVEHATKAYIDPHAAKLNIDPHTANTIRYACGKCISTRMRQKCISPARQKAHRHAQQRDALFSSHRLAQLREDDAVPARAWGNVFTRERERQRQRLRVRARAPAVHGTVARVQSLRGCGAAHASGGCATPAGTPPAAAAQAHPAQRARTHTLTQTHTRTHTLTQTHTHTLTQTHKARRRTCDAFTASSASPSSAFFRSAGVPGTTAPDGRHVSQQSARVARGLPRTHARTDTDRHKEVDRQTDRQTDTQTEKQTGRQAGKAGRLAGKAGRQAGWQRQRQTDRQIQSRARTPPPHTHTLDPSHQTAPHTNAPARSYAARATRQSAAGSSSSSITLSFRAASYAAAGGYRSGMS